MRIILLALLSLCLVSCDNKAEGSGSVANLDSTRQIAIVSKHGSAQVFKIELALTPRQQEIGLMNRTQMDEDAGMLFVFSGEESERAFWMKNTLIPLDMVFIKKNGVIHHIHENAQPNDLTSVPSEGPIYAVLELNGGTAKRFDLREGDRVQHPFFGNP